jgi:formiminotetrahydrofolate cyclodeaminase
MDPVLERSVGRLLEDLARTEVDAAGGSAAALSAAFAASLTTMVARASRPAWQDAGGAIAQAQALRARLCELAESDAQAYGRARALLLRAEQDREHHGVAVAPGGAAAVDSEQLAQALSESAAVPVALAEAAADVAAIAAWAAAEGNADHRADAVIATLLAAAAAQSAAHLVRINLAAKPGDEQLERADRAARAADAERQRVLS